MFVVAFVVAGLNYRYEWMVMPVWAVWSAAVLFLFSYLMYAEVLRENAYLSRTIEVQEGQRVIDTGLYGIVRHPMYSATVLLFLSMPLVLGSLPSFVIMLVYIPLIVKRIKNEETVLLDGLDGYDAYCKKVKYRLLPLVW
jgi:protein-S-isoprenylcysteine O-methyltransferase Ste14